MRQFLPTSSCEEARARLSARRLEGRPRAKMVPDAILRDGHAQQAARDLLRMRPVGCYDRFHENAALGRGARRRLGEERANAFGEGLRAERSAEIARSPSGRG